MNQEIKSKKCNTCHKIKFVTEFHKNNKTSDGFKYICKTCSKKYNKKYKTQNKTAILLQEKKRYLKNREKRIIQQKIWNDNNKIITKIWQRKYKKRRNFLRRRRCKMDISYRLICNTRRKMNNLLKGINKSQKTIDLLGCNGIEYKQHIELFYYKNMTWNTQGSGKNKWQIHHICPLEFFDMRDPIEQKQAWHYSNTIPLWYNDHCEIHRKINERMSQYENNGRLIY
jgi:hypothetical protein